MIDDSTKATSPIDVSALTDLKAAGPDFFNALLDQFGVEGNARLADLEKAERQHDVAGLRRHAHRLKGSAGTMGAHRLSVLCEQLEQIADHREMPSAVNVIAELGREYVRVVEALDRERRFP